MLPDARLLACNEIHRLFNVLIVEPRPHCGLPAGLVNLASPPPVSAATSRVPAGADQLNDRESGPSLLGIVLGNLFAMGLASAVGLAPDRAALASGRAVAAVSSAILLAPVTVWMLTDAAYLRAALCAVPVALALAPAALTVVWRARQAAVPAGSTTEAGRAGC